MLEFPHRQEYVKMLNELDMKSIKTSNATWEAEAKAQLEKAVGFELLGFDLENPMHYKFWQQMRSSGKFHSYCEPKVKAAFIPARE